MAEARRDQWLRLWGDRCQCLVGRVGKAEPLVLLAEIRWLFADLPNKVSVIDQCLLRSLLGQLVSRLLCVHKVDSQIDAARAFLAFASAGFTAHHWQSEFRGLLDQCDLVLGAETISRLAHVQVERALCAIQDRYTDPSLDLDAVAREVGLSGPHITRLLKLHTGQGFLKHLHRRRSSAAHRLLVESSLTVKEIAALVGYGSVTQLGRHFKGYSGATPASIRRLTSAPQRGAS